MYFWDTVRVLTHRWYVFLPICLIAAVAAGVVGVSIPTTHSAGASLLLLNSAESQKAPGGTATGPSNPYRNFDYSLGATGGVVAHVLMNEDTSEALEQRGDSTDYTVTIDSALTAPVVTIAAKHTDPAVVRQTIDDLITRFGDELEARQREAGAPRATWIQMSVISQARTTTPSHGDQIQGGLALFGLGLLAAVGFTYLVEGAFTRRRKAAAAKQRKGSVLASVETAGADRESKVPDGPFPSDRLMGSGGRQA